MCSFPNIKHLIAPKTFYYYKTVHICKKTSRVRDDLNGVYLFLSHERLKTICDISIKSAPTAIRSLLTLRMPRPIYVPNNLDCNLQFQGYKFGNFFLIRAYKGLIWIVTHIP